ncbi:MAG: type II toxin-antitoxin system VapC family toxin [Polyangiaceae bacterium]
MRYVLDASVAVASLRANEPLHSAAAAYLAPLLKGADSIVVPSIFGIEVASALTRAGFTPSDVERFAGAFLARATIVTLGPKRATQIQRVVFATRLRAADAVYAWVAAREGLPLVTADAEMSRRAGAACEVVTL